jgi:hypothetical protein
MDVEREAATRRWLTLAQLMSVVPLRKSRIYYLTPGKFRSCVLAIPFSSNTMR